MNRLFIFLILAAALVGAIVYMQSGDEPLDPRAAIEESLASVEKARELNPAQRDTLRVQLALADYRSANGNCPARLDDLIPRYFDQVPRNPVTKKPFEYHVDGTQCRLGPQDEQKAQQLAAAVSGASSKLGDRSKGKNVAEKEDFINPNAMLAESFTYDPTGKRDPFEPFDFSPTIEDPSGLLTPLQRYTLGQLRVTAILDDTAGGRKAIVEDSGGQGYPVRVGTKIGNAGGEVVSIEADRVKVVESHIDFTGKQVRKPVEMVLTEKVDRKKTRNRRRR